MCAALNPVELPSKSLVDCADLIASGLRQRTLARREWTHAGHLLACISLIRRHGPAEALRTLREAIPAYNTATGVANTSTSGYHDTITVYYVWIVDRLMANGSDPTAVLTDPAVARGALRRWWDTETLMSPAARAAWLPPTLGDGDPDQPPATAGMIDTVAPSGTGVARPSR